MSQSHDTESKMSVNEIFDSQREEAGRKNRPLVDFFKRFFKRPITRVAFGILAIIILAVVLGPLISSNDGTTANFADARQPPSLSHLLGTDDIGRDILARILVGGRVSLLAATVPIAMSIILGIPLGLLSGFSGGWIDDVIMRVMDALLAFPRIILIIAIAGVLGPSLTNALIAIGIVQIAPIARLTRGLTLSAREVEFVTAAQALGAHRPSIMFSHILPNILAPIVVTLSLNVGAVILAEATLSFLGLGIQPPNPSWGSMVASGNRYLQLYPWISLVPGTAIFLTVMSVNLLGDGLRDAMDPYL